jgi:hypothetical protein
MCCDKSNGGGRVTNKNKKETLMSCAVSRILVVKKTLKWNPHLQTPGCEARDVSG